MNAAEVIELLCCKLGIAMDWAGENIVPEIQDLMAQLATTQYTLNHVFWIVGAVGVVLGIVLIIVGAQHYRYYDLSPLVFIGFFMELVCVIMFVVCLIYAIKWKNMPDIMCYKWIANNLRN